MAAWRNEISLLVLKKYFTRSLRSLVKYFSTLEEKFRISVRPCNILSLYIVRQEITRGRRISGDGYDNLNTFTNWFPQRIQVQCNWWTTCWYKCKQKMRNEGPSKNSS